MTSRDRTASAAWHLGRVFLIAVMAAPCTTRAQSVVDAPITLLNLPPVSIEVDVVWHANERPTRVESSLLQAAALQQLVDRGIPVVADGGIPILSITVSVEQVSGGESAYCLRAELRDDAVLTRNLTLEGVVSTWQGSIFGISRQSSEVAAEFDRLIQEFAAAYLRVNAPTHLGQKHRQ